MKKQLQHIGLLLVLLSMSFKSFSQARAVNGTLSVTPSGAANYNIAFDLPSFALDFFPKIGLSYSSQAPDGVAGYGWNITGISSIKKTSASIIHDGYVKEHNSSFTRFSLDGQRLLLKSGTYAAYDSTYETENYSNLKIVYTDDPGYSGFIVYHPDGKKYTYGGVYSGVSAIEWALTKIEDDLGNVVEINYAFSDTYKSTSNLVVSSIEDVNGGIKVEFEYDSKIRQDDKVYGFYNLKNTSLLKKVSIYTNDTNLYRSYTLNHDYTETDYARLIDVTEENGVGTQTQPVEFTYGTNTTFSPTRETLTERVIPGLDLALGESLITGDFDGDQESDFIMYNAEKTEMNVFTGRTNYSSLTYGYPLTYEDGFKDIFAAKTTYSNGNYIDQDGLYLVTNEYSYLEYRPYILGAIGFYAQTTKTLALPASYNKYSGSFIGYAPISKYLNGDFNGDGITDAVAIIGLSFNSDGTSAYGDVYFTDLNRTVTTNYTKMTGTIEGFINTDKYYVDDMNGDGKSDIIVLKDGSIEVWGFNENQELELLDDYVSTTISTDKPLLRGDFNGDGKVDLAYPNANGSTTWYFMSLKGSYYLSRSIKTITGLTYNEAYNSGTNAYTYNYLALDFDSDGKTDILRQYARRGTADAYYSYNFLLNKSNLTFDLASSLSFTSNTYNFPGTFIAPDLLHPMSEENSSIAFLRGNDVDIIRFNTNHNENVRLQSIDNNNHVSNITYDSYYDGQYYSDISYPYGSLKDLPNLKLVNSISETYYGATQHTRTKEFSYYGATMHMQGLEIIGFRSFAESNWQGDDVNPQWTFRGFNVGNRGELLYEAVIDEEPYSYHKPNGYLSMTEYEYDQSTESNGVFINNLVTITTEDTLKGIETTTTNTYDGYNEVNLTTTTFPGGSTKKQFYRGSNPYGLETYYIGRIYSEFETNTLGSESFITRQFYTYNSNQSISAIRKYGNDATSILESFEYDGFGNIIKKTTSSTGLPTRIESFEYNTNGRFLESSTDVDGFTSTYVNDEINGTLLSETDHLGKTTSYEYDGWNRVTKETDYLGNYVSTSYSDSSFSGRLFIYKTSSLRTDGVTEYINIGRMGNIYSKYNRNEFGQLVKKNFRYDILGRIKSESKPYISGVQYTYYYYDEYNRPFQRVGYDGETITTEYDGLTTIVNNGREERSTTTDAAGNVVQVNDDGGTIEYTYYGNGSPKTTSCNGHTITTEIDGWGRKTEMTDPAAGTYTYSYDTYGQLLSETTPKGATTYEYDDNGRITNKKMSGSETDIDVTYIYDANMQISGMDTTDNFNSTTTAYRYFYDDYQRPILILEVGSYGNFQKRISYDEHGRVDLERIITTSVPIANGASGSIITQNVYSPTSGALIAVKEESTGNTLWEAKSVNEYGAYTAIDLGNGITKTRNYDSYGMPTLFNDATAAGSIALNIDYNFNSETKNLTSRDNSFFNGEEVFGYDSQDRLESISGAITHTQSYVNNGNINTNSKVGTYSYDPTTTYQVAGISLNTTGETYFQNHTPQNITYNAFKKPTSIHEAGNGRVDFEYDASMNRKIAYYGGEDENVENRNYKKVYSSIVPVEVVFDLKNATSKIITYLMGDAYSAPIAHIDKGTETEFVYIHRDHLGSVMAITDESANVIEQTHYGAWGNVEKYWDAAGNTTLGYNSVLGRGYTGHEHFTSVGLIHMNGRMYDANLGRFLSPDNFIQDPYNTQSFNRYSYVLNNPLKFVDPTGELSWKSIGNWIKKNSQVITLVATVAVAVVATVATAGLAAPLAAAIVGGAAAATAGAVGTWTSGGSFLEGLGNGFVQGVIGAVSGYVGAGVGQFAMKHVGSTLLNSAILKGPALKAIVGNVLGASITSFAGTAVSGGLSGQSGSEILKSSLRSAAVSGLIAVATGTIQGIKQAKADGVNPWTGKPIGNVAQTNQSLDLGNYSVYEGIDDDGLTKYIGITKRDPNIRWDEHLNSFGTGKEFLHYQLIPGATNLDKTTARMLEQSFINHYGLQKEGGLLLNQINSINKSKWHLFSLF